MTPFNRVCAELPCRVERPYLKKRCWYPMRVVTQLSLAPVDITSAGIRTSRHKSNFCVPALNRWPGPVSASHTRVHRRSAATADKVSDAVSPSPGAPFRIKQCHQTKFSEKMRHGIFVP